MLPRGRARLCLCPWCGIPQLLLLLVAMRVPRAACGKPTAQRPRCGFHVLVTGANGYLGSVIVKQLLDQVGGSASHARSLALTAVYAFGDPFTCHHSS
jgi:hypothetical protein